MAPVATFVSWTLGSSLFERASDLRNFEVSVQDRASVSIEETHLSTLIQLEKIHEYKSEYNL